MKIIGAATRARSRASSGLLGTTSAGATMGIYDREYYRDETRGSGFLSGAAPACKTIILLNVAFFLARALFPNAYPLVESSLGARSDLIFHFQVHRLITATFLHQWILQLAMNMIVLWWAGREMEAMYGSIEFSSFYLTAAAVSTFCWAVVDYFGPWHVGLWPIGSQGPLTAVVVLFALYYPHREVNLFGLVRLEIWMLLVIYLGYDVFCLLQQSQNGSAVGVVFASHMGGAAYGFLYKTLDLRWTRMLRRRPLRPRVRMVAPEPRGKVAPISTSQSRSASAGSSRSSSAVAVSQEQLDARLDEVLAKIAREGRGGLTEEENRILQEASQRARDRRSDRL
jgi:rhomboid family protein